MRDVPIFSSKRKVQSLGDSLALTLPSLYTKINEINKGKNLTTYFCTEDIIIISQDDDFEKLKIDLDIFIRELEKKNNKV